MIMAAFRVAKEAEVLLSFIFSAAKVLALRIGLSCLISFNLAALFCISELFGTVADVTAAFERARGMLEVNCIIAAAFAARGRFRSVSRFVSLEKFDGDAVLSS